MLCVTVREPPSVRRWFVNLRHEHVSDFENEIACAAIANGQLMSGAEPVEDGQAIAEERDARRSDICRPWLLVTIRSQAARGFEVLEIAN